MYSEFQLGCGKPAQSTGFIFVKIIQQAYNLVKCVAYAGFLGETDTPYLALGLEVFRSSQGAE